MFEAWLVALHLIMVHAPDGEEIFINIEEISSIREPGENSLLSSRVHCVVGMTNAKFISTKETCREVILELAKYDKMQQGQLHDNLGEAK